MPTHAYGRTNPGGDLLRPIPPSTQSAILDNAGKVRYIGGLKWDCVSCKSNFRGDRS